MHMHAQTKTFAKRPTCLRRPDWLAAQWYESICDVISASSCALTASSTTVTPLNCKRAQLTADRMR